jgi:hypothetical protein
MSIRATYCSKSNHFCLSFPKKFLKKINSKLTWIFVAVWTFSALITYMVFHLINTISLNKIIICRHCRTENVIDSKHCSEFGKKLILVLKKQ